LEIPSGFHSFTFPAAGHIEKELREHANVESMT